MRFKVVKLTLSVGELSPPLNVASSSGDIWLLSATRVLFSKPEKWTVTLLCRLH